MKEHIEYLQNLGLTEYQSRALLIVLAKKEVGAEEICRYSGISPTKIYQVMKTLRDMELVECTISKPRLYRIEEPSEVLNVLLQKFVKRIEWLKDSKREQLKKIKTIELQVMQKESVHPMFQQAQVEVQA